VTKTGKPRPTKKFMRPAHDMEGGPGVERRKGITSSVRTFGGGEKIVPPRTLILLTLGVRG